MTEFLDFTLPAGGFSGPVAMWLACHQRLEGVCGLMQRFSRHLEDFGFDEAARFSAEGLRRYFNGATRRHQEDEDVDLFPRVLDRLSGRRRATVRTMMTRLQEDHVTAERLWRPVDEQLGEVQQGRRRTPDRQAIETLVDAHLGHRNAEESALLDVVRTSLQPVDLKDIGEAMARRRGLTWTRLNGGAL